MSEPFNFVKFLESLVLLHGEIRITKMVPPQGEEDTVLICLFPVLDREINIRLRWDQENNAVSIIVNLDLSQIEPENDDEFAHLFGLLNGINVDGLDRLARLVIHQVEEDGVFELRGLVFFNTKFPKDFFTTQMGQDLMRGFMSFFIVQVASEAILYWNELLAAWEKSAMPEKDEVEDEDDEPPRLVEVPRRLH